MPDSGLLLYDDQVSGRLAKPVEFTEKAVLTGRGLVEATIWFSGCSTWLCGYGLYR